MPKLDLVRLTVEAAPKTARARKYNRLLIGIIALVLAVVLTAIRHYRGLPLLHAQLTAFSSSCESASLADAMLLLGKLTYQRVEILLLSCTGAVFIVYGVIDLLGRGRATLDIAMCERIRELEQRLAILETETRNARTIESGHPRTS